MSSESCLGRPPVRRLLTAHLLFKIRKQLSIRSITAGRKEPWRIDIILCNEYVKPSLIISPSLQSGILAHVQLPHKPCQSRLHICYLSTDKRPIEEHSRIAKRSRPHAEVALCNRFPRSETDCSEPTRCLTALKSLAAKPSVCSSWLQRRRSPS